MTNIYDANMRMLVGGLPPVFKSNEAFETAKRYAVSYGVVEVCDDDGVWMVHPDGFIECVEL